MATRLQTSAMRVSLAGSSGTTFYTTPTGSNSSQAMSVTIPQGQDSVPLWVQSTALGPDTLSATASNGVFVSTLNLTVGNTPQLSFSPTSMVVKGSVPVRQWIPFYVSLPASNVVGETVTLNTTDSNASLYDTAASNSPVTSVYVAAGATVPMYFQDPNPYDYGNSVSISADDASGTTASPLSLSITPASAVQIVITANTFDVTAGTPVQYTLRLLDQYGNPSVAPSTGVPIALSATTEWGGSASGTGVAFSVGKTPVTSVTIPGGKSTVTVDVTGTIAGGYEIDATASGYSSGSFFGNYPLVVNPASASQLALLSDPTGTYIYDGYIMTPVTVSLEDQYGNPTDSGQTEVALSSSTAGGEFFIDSNDNYETCADPSGQISQVSLGSSSDNGSTVTLWYAQPISATSSATLSASAAGLTTQTTTLPELFVSTSGSSTGTGTYSDPYSSIADALAVAPTGATIIVEPGTYKGPINITNAVNLVANGSVTINASGEANGVVISGENSDGSLVYGFTIENAGNAGVDLTSSTFGDEVADNTFSNDYFGVYNAIHGEGYLDYWINTFNSSVTIPYYSPYDPEAVPPSKALTVNLQPGWNTLSLPYVLSSTSLAALENVLTNAQSSFAYQNGSWVQVTTSNEASILNTAMAGLYIDIPQSAGYQTITLTPTLAQMPPPTIALQDGWNLVGPSSSSSYSESDTGFLSAASGLPSSDLAMISNPNDGGIAAIPNPLGGTTEVIEVSDGLAYWVYAQNLPSSGATLVGEIPTGNASSTPFIGFF